MSPRCDCARARHRRGRVHRLPPRRSPARGGRARSRSSTTSRAAIRDNLADALKRGARAAGGRGHRRRRDASRRSSARRPEVVSTWPPRSTCAARSRIPPTDAHVNVVGTAACWRRPRGRHAARDLRLHGGASTATRRDLPTPEDSPTAPLCPTARARPPAETLHAALHARCTASRTLALRMANVYGPRQDPHGEAGVVAIFSGAAREGRTGDDLRRRHADARLRVRQRRGGRVRRRGPPFLSRAC